MDGAAVGGGVRVRVLYRMRRCVGAWSSGLDLGGNRFVFNKK